MHSLVIQDCAIELTIGRRYGLIGANGSGKTNFLQCLANREVRGRLLISPCACKAAFVFHTPCG